MAEGRMLRRRIALDKRIARLSTDRARLLFTWGIAFTDVEGRMLGDPDVVKVQVVPFLTTMTPETIQQDLEECASVGLIRLYTVNGEQFVSFPAFHKNQQLRKDREAKSQIPAPPADSGSTPGVVREDSWSTPAEVKLSKENSSRRRSAPDEECFQLAAFIRDSIAAIKGDAKLPTTTEALTKWADQVRLMRDRDARTPERIRAVMTWAMQDSFWRGNVLCPEKLRKQFDTLELRMAAASASSTGRPAPSPPEPNAELRRIREQEARIAKENAALAAQRVPA